MQMVLSVLLVDLSLTIMQMTVSVAIMQFRSFSSTFAGDSFCSHYVVTVFIVIKQESLCCNYAGGVFCID